MDVVVAGVAADVAADDAFVVVGAAPDVADVVCVCPCGCS